MRTLFLSIIFTFIFVFPSVSQDKTETENKYFQEYNKYIPVEYDHFDHLKSKLQILKGVKTENLLSDYPFDLFFTIESTMSGEEPDKQALTYLFKILPFFKEQYTDQNFTKTFYFPHLLIGPELDFFFNNTGAKVKSLEYIVIDEVRYTVTDPYTDTLYSFKAKFPNGENLKDAVLLFNKNLADLNNPHGEE